MNREKNKVQEFMRPSLSGWNKTPENSSDDTIHVMMLIPWMELGGADKFNLDVLKRIDKSRFSMTIVCTVKAENQWRELFEKECKDIHILPDFLDMREYTEYLSYLIMSKPIDMIFLTSSYYGYYVIPWIKCHFPKVAVIDYVHMEEWYWRNGGYARVSGLSGPFIEKTFVCNHVTNGVITEHFGRKKESVETLYIGVDEQRFDPSKIPYGTIREKYGISEEKKVILFPCRIHAQKRPFLLLEIAKKLTGKMNNVMFFVAGNGPQYKEFLDKIKKEKLQDYFVCPGEISNMEAVYRDCDVTIICSLKEGLSLTAYESCAMMTPVITADVGGQKELIDESVGKVIPMLQDESDIDNRNYSEEEIDAYVAAIEGLLADEERYQEKCENCRKKIVDKFSTELMVHTLEQRIEEIVDEIKNKEIDVKLYETISPIAENYLTTYIEYEDSGRSLSYGQNMNEELKRIANSKWGKRAIKLMMKLKLNRIFH